MKWIRKLVLTLVVLGFVLLRFNTMAYADDVGDAGGTGQGNITGSNVYTFSYIYDSARDAIELRVDTKYALSSFGNTTSHTYTSLSDQIVLHTQNPICGNSIDNAIADMNRIGGYNLSVSEVKSALNNLGFYDKGNGVWKYDGGYLTYVSAVKIRPRVHTIHYDANGGSGAPGNQTKTEGQALYLSTARPTRTGYTFKYWIASIGGNYNPGANYTHDQDGGTVTMTAYWKDETAPNCSSFSAIPNHWSDGNGTVTYTVRDQGSGLASIVLERYSYVTRTWSTVKTTTYSGTTASTSGSYTETSEGVFYYKLTIKDKTGNVTTKTSAAIYLDHSNPVLSGMNTTVTSWTNVAPVISVNATDYLYGTTYGGSGLNNVVIKDDLGNIVASGISSARYTLVAKYEGIHTWYITVTDNVGHTSSAQVSTKYDITKPGVDGTEVTDVVNGVTVSGYFQDNIIDQNIDDKASRSINQPNLTSGLKSVIMYKIKGTTKTAIYSDSTKISFGSSNTNSCFHLYYDANPTEDDVDYYQIVAQDYAGNTTTKKLITQKSLLTWFHTSIDRSSYE